MMYFALNKKKIWKTRSLFFPPTTSIKGGRAILGKMRDAVTLKFELCEKHYQDDHQMTRNRTNKTVSQGLFLDAYLLCCKTAVIPKIRLIITK